MTIVAANIAAPFRAGVQAAVPSGRGGFDECLSRLPIAADPSIAIGQSAPGAVVMGTAALLLGQAVADDRRRRDRDATERSGRLLALLTRLQCCGLRNGVETDEVLAELSSVLEAMPEASDPGLARVAASIELRVHVELARRGS